MYIHKKKNGFVVGNSLESDEYVFTSRVDMLLHVIKYHVALQDADLERNLKNILEEITN